MASYTAEVVDKSDGIVTVRLSFGEPAQNDRIVKDAVEAIASLKLEGGKGIKLNGPCSVPAAIAIGHAVVHLFGYVAFFDPKLHQYVVCVSHDPSVRPGDLIGNCEAGK
jgi:CRISPR-associated protein Csx3